MRKIIIGITSIAVLAFTAVGGIAANASSSSRTTSAVTGGWVSSSNPAYAPGLKGTSHFTEKGTTIRVRIDDWGLSPNRSYFTVLYGNTNCDPAQAFVFGPFYTDSTGAFSGKLTKQDTTGIVGGVVAATGGQNGNPLGSISTRIGDTDASGNPTDQDGDGLYGPTDVVAVPGTPSIGLVQCDSMPIPF